jgi:glycosyltransferase involved in cell wall biosynthesis
MNIEVYCLANNEEKLMPYYMRHYSQFAKVILLDNNSTDRTVEIAKSLGAEIRTLNIPDEINDQLFVAIRNECWKGSKADWMMWADADEFIYHPNLLDILQTTSATAILPAFYNMYSGMFPTTEGQIYEEVQYGSRWGGEENIYGKVNIFKLPDITEINYNPGCHHVDLRGNVILDTHTEIKTLHMRNLSREFVIARNQRNSRRLGALNRKNGWGTYVDRSPEEIIKLFDEEMAETIKVV